MMSSNCQLSRKKDSMKKKNNQSTYKSGKTFFLHQKNYLSNPEKWLIQLSLYWVKNSAKSFSASTEDFESWHLRNY